MSWSARLSDSARRAARSLAAAVPVMVGVLLLSSLAAGLLRPEVVDRLFTHNALLDAVAGGAVGSVASGNPLVSYLLGGELLERGVSLAAVTAFIVSWVTVGLVQLPAEAVMLGRRFAFYRNAIAFACAVAVAFLTPATLGLVG